METTECTYDELMNELEYYKQTYNELKLIMDTSFDEITITDGDGIFLRVSKSAEKIFGRPESEIVGKSAYVLEKEGMFDKSTTVAVLNSREKTTFLQQTGSGRRMIVTGIPMFDSEENIIRIINMSRDITEIEELETKLEETQGILEWFRGEMFRKQVIERKKILGNSPAMQKIIALMNQVAELDTTVLLLGETGVGKSLFAKTIHQMSQKRNEPFIQINCGAIPETLLESELFGYEGGAFTGASKKGKIGLFETANEGTIFLDEIAEMPMQLQVKLLNVLQDREAYRIGGTKPFPIKARIISATNKNLKELIETGKFREDLYYRLNVVPITIPALRERREDIPLLIKNFLEKYNSKHCTSKTISPRAYTILSSYDFPGNIRELENMIERLVITCCTDLINETHLLDIIPSLQEYPDLGAAEIVPLKQAREELERRMLINALNKYTTTRKAASALEIDQSTLVKKLKKLNIRINDVLQRD